MDKTFLAPPEEVLDWRQVVVTSIADDARILDQLPGTPAEIAAELGLDDKSVRVILEALTVWGAVIERDGHFAPGPDLPDESDRQLLRQHSQFLRRWVNELPRRLQDSVDRQRAPRSPEALADWLRALGTRARGNAPRVIDRCLQAFPGATSALDVAGGHGEYGIETARRGLEVTLVDLPAVIDVVNDWPRPKEAGIELWPGDVFEKLPDRTFDLVLCFGFSHTMPPERARELFARLATATTPGGGIAVSTFVRGRGPVTQLFAVQMLVAGNGGDTHLLEDYERWLAEAGYGSLEIVDLDHNTLLLARRQ